MCYGAEFVTVPDIVIPDPGKKSSWAYLSVPQDAVDVRDDQQAFTGRCGVDKPDEENVRDIEARIMRVSASDPCAIDRRDEENVRDIAASDQDGINDEDTNT